MTTYLYIVCCVIFTLLAIWLIVALIAFIKSEEIMNWNDNDDDDE